MEMRLLKQKKGIYYTLVSVLAIALLITYNNFDDNSRLKQRGDLLSNRASAMDDFLGDIEKDMERMIKISSYRTLLSLEKYISDNQGFLNDFDDDFFNMFVDGNFNGTNYDLMEDASIIDWKDRVNEEANLLNLEFDTVPVDIEIVHLSPWDIKITLTATLLLEDFNSDISWNYTKNISNTMSIIDFEDPLYKVYSFDKVINLVVRASYLDFINDSNNNNSDVLQTHINNSYYIESPTGPSFLMRFEGNLSNSSYGIESFVNLEDFQRQNLEVYNRSLIDYIYFDPSSGDPDYCDFDDLQEWVAIDASHLNDYEMNKLDYSLC
ncbi:hypothetical protein C0585_00760 [Candidatus Woesearchaeota archaeon]|nr:MAG: hypothetical protein C0585_00760 [Candidatus Woesearchaeota archaeon]